MPPRRSCFGSWHHGPDGPNAVSMPPRRSCFGERGRGRELGILRFNATTAFLLQECLERYIALLAQFQCHHGVPASVSLSARHLRPARFQCHHGVPASGWGPTRCWCYPTVSMPPRRSCFRLLRLLLRLLVGVSMPPRRSCFLLPFSSLSSSFTSFQCHHGVPASLLAAAWEATEE